MVDSGSNTNPDMLHNSVSALVGDTAIDFSLFHQQIYRIINKWMKNEASKAHPKWMLWKKWVWKGLKDKHTLHEIKKILEINSLSEYITLMECFPPFHTSVQLHWNEDHSKFRYHITPDLNLALPTLNTGMEEKIQSLTQELTAFNDVFEVQITNMTKRLTDVESKILSCEHNLKTHFEQYRNRLVSTTRQ